MLQFPKNHDTPVVETALMRLMATRTLAVHRGGALVVWSGRHRLGKTTTARWLERQINTQYEAEKSGRVEADPERPAFRAKHYQVAQIPDWVRSPEKRAIQSLYHALVGPLDEGLYRRLPAEDLARQLVTAIQKRDLEMMFVDEAGKLSLDALDGMVSVRDKAEEMGHTLSIVFVGMGDLPVKIEQRPRIYSRVHEWCTFKEYELSETWDFLAKVHPHFAGLDREDPEHREQVAFVHEVIGGFPGELVPFLRKLDAKQAATGSPINLLLLKAVHLFTETDRGRAVDLSGQTNPDTGSKAPRRKSPRQGPPTGRKPKGPSTGRTAEKRNQKPPNSTDSSPDSGDDQSRNAERRKTDGE